MQDEFGETALHGASGEGHVQIMTVLIQRGANVNSLSKVCVSIIFPQHVCLNFSRVHVCVWYYISLASSTHSSSPILYGEV